MGSLVHDDHLERRNRRTMLVAFGAALAMLGLGYAAVPLYDLFCRVTGFGGTTQVASEAEADIAARLAASAGGQTYSIRFDANTARNMPWDFRPVQVTDTITIGQRDMATYIARNNSSEPVTGTATFNVEPKQAGRYFNKIQCFCFTEQTLQPGQEVRMPVLYYVDPAALDDPNMEGVEQITLSYTFHRAIENEEQAEQGI
ncbi:putative cytochrome c oxidase assembly transmembrane protein [Aurantiacibacter atlanticus]|uniref:Cytochrome c oxidase assembly protein CtaG n=1 Tax=Aurantiacibacter atlanticus TaxID=1648404 RepID=A0A0H4VG13_9SPHN|nr:cytochrome c oxidase assembly protein [Aurantiacibacter atlanticus]AKQ41761.1 putative cytochrome c oxidase assembly transmembrane protein [Aurantiacibacter atlanticus]MDF1833777.1 cytochrome c oxidase assembly protein [Alteraurantiacibacter sp. bin_em_oilr2.035]